MFELSLLLIHLLDSLPLLALRDNTTASMKSEVMKIMHKMALKEYISARTALALALLTFSTSIMVNNARRQTVVVSNRKVSKSNDFF